MDSEAAGEGLPVIAVVDSGVGGVTVWRELSRMLPRAELRYLADTHGMPYGDKTLSHVRARCEAIARFLVAEGVGVVVLACNTASAAALRHLRRVMPEVPFVGMEPAVKPAVTATRSGVVAVMATQATFQGELYVGLLGRFGPMARVIEVICPELARIVEDEREGETESLRLLREWIGPALAEGADHLVLGCTHYPLIADVIARVAGTAARVVDPSPAVARQAATVAARTATATPGRPGRRVFYVTGGDALGFLGKVSRRGGGDGELVEPAWSGGEEPMVLTRRPV